MSWCQQTNTKKTTRNRRHRRHRANEKFISMQKRNFVAGSLYFHQTKGKHKGPSLLDDDSLAGWIACRTSIYVCMCVGSICFSLFLASYRKKKDNNKAWLWRSIFHIRRVASLPTLWIYERSYISSDCLSHRLFIIIFSFPPLYYFLLRVYIINRSSFISFSRIEILISGLNKFAILLPLFFKYIDRSRLFCVRCEHHVYLQVFLILF